MLSDWMDERDAKRGRPCLNAPYGAPYFLTHRLRHPHGPRSERVLMHLMALHAF